MVPSGDAVRGQGLVWGGEACEAQSAEMPSGGLPCLQGSCVFPGDGALHSCPQEGRGQDSCWAGQSFPGAEARWEGDCLEQQGPEVAGRSLTQWLPATQGKRVTMATSAEESGGRPAPGATLRLSFP